MNQDQILKEPNSYWGGVWTKRKLDAFAKYVWSYLTIMKKRTFLKTIYFDGFAGSGSRNKHKNSELYTQLHLTEEEESVYKGAAERVISLKDNLSFDYYYFIDMNNKALDELQKKLNTLPESKGKKLVFRTGDCNEQLKRLAESLKQNKYAALILLDPFGMQISWESIKQLKDTRSDIWILVPTGVVVNRLLDRKGEITHIKKLESFFGLTEDEIRNEFYVKSNHQTLFGDQIELVNKVLDPIEKIVNVYIKQLKTIWDHVMEKPLTLENSKNVTIFHFIFASNNKNAVRIAKEIIKPV
ncbi:MAG TPA: three-Cys-motif partner protein TcmP [Draconibacterium sp.]|nr:three-Cys-motif partner protein TcmP [Draconibacterium sp.]HRX11346.1 three-Cys-motif partner protein TcmP [Draconibacterium sp.]